VSLDSGAMLPPAMMSLFQSRTTYQYMEVASIALFAYDFCLTVGDAVEFIWKKTWTFSSVLFITTRYLPFIEGALVLVEAISPNPSNSTCEFLLHSRVWLVTIGLFIAELILVLRTTAIWDGNRKIGTSLLL